MSSIFLSHSHVDKPFVNRLAADLRRAGARVWVDEAEIRIGDSLIKKIQEGIDEMEYVGAVLSPSSVASKWVQHELDVAMNQEIEGKRVKILPIVLQECDMPGCLAGKLYADFRNDKTYATALGQVLKRLGIELKPPPTDARSLFTLLSAAIASHEEDLTRKAIVGFLELPDGANVSLVRDVVGSISSWAQRSGTTTSIELTVGPSSIRSRRSPTARSPRSNTCSTCRTISSRLRRPWRGASRRLISRSGSQPTSCSMVTARTEAAPMQ